MRDGKFLAGIGIGGVGGATLVYLLSGVALEPAPKPVASYERINEQDTTAPVIHWVVLYGEEGKLQGGLCVHDVPKEGDSLAYSTGLASIVIEEEGKTEPILSKEYGIDQEHVVVIDEQLTGLDIILTKPTTYTITVTDHAGYTITKTEVVEPIEKQQTAIENDREAPTLHHIANLSLLYPSNQIRWSGKYASDDSAGIKSLVVAQEGKEVFSRRYKQGETLSVFFSDELEHLNDPITKPTTYTFTVTDYAGKETSESVTVKPW